MTRRPVMIVRRTGERIYLDDEEPHREPPVPGYERPAPPIFVECELCARPWQQVEWARFEVPFVCAGCSFSRRLGLQFGDVSSGDYRLIGGAHAVLKALEAEVDSVRRAAL